ncbi:hypothetical protein B0H17DRAFT_1210773 [Mycena rosella]|uniref:Uncharacterized protein n=1 Tax=Mycena rosella TaxID=1033263 RepID=A0AAD7CW41_MYCRO|nr:hypothetical protein B0H17DRAFT_1210773 [Mycena rosella]
MPDDATSAASICRLSRPERFRLLRTLLDAALPGDVPPGPSKSKPLRSHDLIRRLAPPLTLRILCLLSVSTLNTPAWEGLIKYSRFRVHTTIDRSSHPTGTPQPVALRHLHPDAAGPA